MDDDKLECPSAGFTSTRMAMYAGMFGGYGGQGDGRDRGNNPIALLAMLIYYVIVVIEAFDILLLPSQRPEPFGLVLWAVPFVALVTAPSTIPTNF